MLLFDIEQEEQITTTNGCSLLEVKYKNGHLTRLQCGCCNFFEWVLASGHTLLVGPSRIPQVNLKNLFVLGSYESL